MLVRGVLPFVTVISSYVDFVAGTANEWFVDHFRHFVTEPNIRSYRTLLIDRVEDDSLLSPGHIFYAPFSKMGRQRVGPHIMDQNGELIWWGNDSAQARVQNFHVCDYMGTTGSHLCWSEATFSVFKEQGTNHILDNTYTHITPDFEAVYPMQNPNPHEFNLLPGGRTFLQTVYQLRPMDLTAYAGTKEGFIFDGCFQEVDAATGKQLFRWCGLDHLEIWHTKIFLHIPANTANWTGEAYGEGTLDSPWDYFHINSVDKTPSGDYLVSARHLDQILKIAGPDAQSVHGVTPGSILWRLGGRFNDFNHAERTDLSRQHHVRLISQDSRDIVISLFNNQWHNNDSVPGSRHMSNVQIVTLNTNTMTVVSAKKFYQPEAYLSLAQGSVQVLPNGNVFVGWGTLPQFSEFSADGKLLYHMHLDQYYMEKGTSNMQNYRIFKFPWIGHPTQPPKLIVYSQTCTPSSTTSTPSSSSSLSPLVAYVSWNGATEVKHWRFYRSSFGGMGPWLPAGKILKTKFETKFYLKGVFGGKAPFAGKVRVQALDARGYVLAETVAETFVPGDVIAGDCSAEGCFKREWFTYDAELGCGKECESVYGSVLFVGFVVVGLVLGVVVLYVVGLMGMEFWKRWCDKRRRRKGYVREEALKERLLDDEELEEGRL